MDLFGFLKGQLVDVIDWVEEPGTLALRYPMASRAIKNGASLTVREGQIAFFYDEGELADAFPPGSYTLETANLPVLTALLNWDKGFNSPFKADVYFFSQKEQAGLKWGTAQPITVRDPDFGALRIRAFGSYSFRVDNVPLFAAKVVGTLAHVSVADVEPQLRSAIVTALAATLGGSDAAFLDLAADQVRLSQQLEAAVAPAFAAWGLACRSCFVESLSLPDEVQAHLDRAGAARAVDASQATGADASREGAMAPSDDAFAQLEKLHRLLTLGAITQAEFDAKKAELLGRIG